MLRFRFARPALAVYRWSQHLVTDKLGFRILIFHDIPPSGRQAFEDLIVYLKDMNALISPNQAEAWVSGTIPENLKPRASTPPCLISFDDGFIGNYELAQNFLAPHSIKALFFICPELVNLPSDIQLAAVSNNVFTCPPKRDPGDPKLRLMSWEHINNLASSGHTIGAHGMAHLSLASLKGQALSNEIISSGDVVEDHISKPVDWFAYAFGSIENITASALQIVQQRFSFCRSGVRGLNTESTLPHCQFGDHVDLSAPIAYQLLTIEGGLDPLYSSQRERLRSMLNINLPT